MLKTELRTLCSKVSAKRKFYLLAKAAAVHHEALWRAHDMWGVWEYVDTFAEIDVSWRHMAKRIEEINKRPWFFTDEHEVLRRKMAHCIRPLTSSEGSFSYYGLTTVLGRMRDLATDGAKFETHCRELVACIFGRTPDGHNELQRQLHFAGQREARWPAWTRWRGGLIPTAARGTYEERSFGSLPILADMMDDAGVEDAEMTSHFRSGGPHCRGCWALDLLIGKR